MARIQASNRGGARIRTEDGNLMKNRYYRFKLCLCHEFPDGNESREGGGGGVGGLGRALEEKIKFLSTFGAEVNFGAVAHGTASELVIFPQSVRSTMLSFHFSFFP